MTLTLNGKRLSEFGKLLIKGWGFGAAHPVFAKVLADREASLSRLCRMSQHSRDDVASILGRYSGSVYDLERFYLRWGRFPSETEGSREGD
jgi:hypothetical protein